VKADKSKMFSVSLTSIKFEDGVPFPLFIFLKRNDRFIPIRLPGEALGSEKYQKFLDAQHLELWVPNNFQDAFNAYAQYLNHTGQPVADLKKIVEGTETLAPETPAEMAEATAPAAPKSEEAALVKDVLMDEELTSEEKAEVLSTVSQDVLRALNQITTRGEPARAEGLKRCKEIADEVLMVAGQSSNIYDEILALRSSQEEIEHSVIVGTVAVMFGMALGFSDEKLLADMAVAAIFHDIGLIKVKPEVMAKKETEWSATERKEYEFHVKASLDLLNESGTGFHPRVLRMVSEHHENYDGSGFPNSLKGMQIDDTSQLLHMANLFDRLCTGKQTGTELAPSEAFDYIYELVQQEGAVQEIKPELVERVFEFMSNEKSAALAEDHAQKHMQKAMDTNA